MFPFLDLLMVIHLEQWLFWLDKVMQPEPLGHPILELFL
jgi:hypothetical protein